MFLGLGLSQPLARWNLPRWLRCLGHSELLRPCAGFHWRSGELAAAGGCSTGLWPDLVCLGGLRNLFGTCGREWWRRGRLGVPPGGEGKLLGFGPRALSTWWIRSGTDGRGVLAAGWLCWGLSSLGKPERWEAFGLESGVVHNAETSLKTEKPPR